VNLGLDENAKLNDGKKYHKRVQTSETSCGQRVSPDQLEAKNTLESSKRQHRCILCNRAFNYRKDVVLHMQKKHAGLFIVCKHNGRCAEFFRTEAEKSEHILKLTNINDQLIKCNFCCLMYNKSGKVHHLKRHHKNLIQCSYRQCTIRFHSEVEKQNHEALMHAATKKDKCIFCNLFFSEVHILNHYRMKHKTLLANAFMCKFHCRRYFLTEADREEHIASAHKFLVRAEGQHTHKSAQ